MTIVVHHVVASGQKYNVSAPLSALETLIESGGSQVVTSGGFADDALVHGTEVVSSGGSDRSSQVYSGGVEEVGSDGISYNAVIFAGATEKIYSGGTASGSHILGSQDVKSGGTAYYANVSSAVTGDLRILDKRYCGGGWYGACLQRRIRLRNRHLWRAARNIPTRGASIGDHCRERRRPIRLRILGKRYCGRRRYARRRLRQGFPGLFRRP